MGGPNYPQMDTNNQKSLAETTESISKSINKSIETIDKIIYLLENECCKGNCKNGLSDNSQEIVIKSLPK